MSTSLVPGLYKLPNGSRYTVPSSPVLRTRFPRTVNHEEGREEDPTLGPGGSVGLDRHGGSVVPPEPSNESKQNQRGGYYAPVLGVVCSDSLTRTS